MNQKQFEVWKKQKVRDLAIDLNKLSEDFAGRGLASSGLRNQAEDDLKQKYASEIEITRLGIENDIINENNMEDDFENMKESSRNPKVSIVTGNVKDSIISGNTVHYSNSNNTKTEKESFWSKFFWQVIVALIVPIGGALILKHFLGI